MLVINPQRIEAEMLQHLVEYRRLRRFLKLARQYGKPETPSDSVTLLPGDEPRAGRQNPLVDRMRAFVLEQGGTFDHKALKSPFTDEEALKHRVREAIRILANEGVLEIIKPPNGRFVGEYRRKESLNGKAAESLIEPPAAVPQVTKPLNGDTSLISREP